MASRNKKIAQPPAYRDAEFMDSLAARPVRILTEYIDPLVRLRRESVGDTIVIFGSARIMPPERAQARLKRLTSGRHKPSPQHRAAVHQARALLEMSSYYHAARELSRRITEWSLTFGEHPRRFVVCSGGGPGIMEAANRGAAEAGGKTIGLSIELPREQAANRYISPELNFQFHYFFMRKLWFAQLAKALIIFPGGFGTMDELFEMLTLMQTGKLGHRVLILIYGRSYWDKIVNWQEMVRAGAINQREHGLLQFADSVDEAFRHIRRGLEKFHVSPDTLVRESI
jgi:uncharacterized protein (TIGR00730 family)